MDRASAPAQPERGSAHNRPLLRPVIPRRGQGGGGGGGSDVSGIVYPLPPRPLHSKRGCEGTVIWGMFPWGCEDTVARGRLLDKGGGGVG